MKEFYVDWETDYCDDFPESSGTELIRAETPEEAVKKFYESNKTLKALVMEVTERKK